MWSLRHVLFMHICLYFLKQKQTQHKRYQTSKGSAVCKQTDIWMRSTYSVTHFYLFTMGEKPFILHYCRIWNKFSSSLGKAFKLIKQMLVFVPNTKRPPQRGSAPLFRRLNQVLASLLHRRQQAHWAHWAHLRSVCTSSGSSIWL